MNTGDNHTLANDKVISKQFFRLLPVQILLVAIPSLNGIISSIFGSNLLGETALSAIGMYAPILSFMTAIGTMLMGGSQILCGKYMGSNQVERTQEIFSLDLTTAAILSLIISAVLLVTGTFDLAGFMNPDTVVRSVFNRYLIGMAIGIFPMLMGNQISAFLSMEMQGKRSTVATVLFVITNLVLTLLFLGVLRMQAFGLALAASIGYWVYLIYQVLYYFSGKSILKLKLVRMHPSDISEIVMIGFPGALTQLYLTIRRLVLNGLMVRYIGTAGLSSFQASDSLLAIFWSIPLGMAAVSRMMMSVAVGEEDRQSLKDILKTMITRCMLIEIGVMAALILCAVPFTRVYYRDVTEPIYQMTLNGFRLLPITMPLGLFCQMVLNYAQVIRKQLLVHTEAALDGAVCVCIAALLLVPSMGMNGVYLSLIINGIATAVYPLLYSIVYNRGVPKNADALLMIPEDFGAAENERMDISLTSLDEVVNLSKQIQDFCIERGVDERRSYLSGLFLEEMAGNVIEGGFPKDNKKHSVDVRVVHKDDDIILRIKDDCVAFDPLERAKLFEPEDITKNIGIRMVSKIAQDVAYQNILGLNVLTIRI